MFQTTNQIYVYIYIIEWAHDQIFHIIHVYMIIYDHIYIHTVRCHDQIHPDSTYNIYSIIYKYI